MHANISIILSLLTISINSINCTNLCNSTESITTLSPPKKRIQPAKRIVSNNDSIEIPESRVTLENLGGGKVRKLFTGRISGWCPADFEADWAVFLFFFFNSGTRWLHVRPPAAIDQPRKLLPVQIFFPPFVLELARTTSSRPAFPIHLLRSSSALREASSPLLFSPLLQDGRSRRGRDSKLRICFSTSLFTFSRRRAQDEWGRKARRVNRRRRRRRLAFLTLISSFLFFSFPFISLSFSPPLPRIPFERARFSFPDRNSMMNGYWNKVMPMLMLRNVSKLGEYDLLRRAIPFENTFVFVFGRLNVTG